MLLTPGSLSRQIQRKPKGRRQRNWPTAQDTHISSARYPTVLTAHTCVSTHPHRAPLSTLHVGERGLYMEKLRHTPSKQLAQRHTAGNSRAMMWPKGQAPTFVFVATPCTRWPTERGSQGKREKNISDTLITTVRKI